MSIKNQALNLKKKVGKKFIKGLAVLTLSLSLTLASHSAELNNAKTETKKVKDVIVCFDGSYNLDKWESTMNLADELSNLTKQDVHFMYYINTAYFFTKMKGSKIGTGGSQDDINKRIKLAQKAIDKRHEIGSHTVRHRDGGKWTVKQWKKEISEFDKHVAMLFHDINGKPYKAVGFRAPYLSWNDNLYKALHNLGYVYDVSSVGTGTGKKEGIKIKGVPLYTRDSGKLELGMDYNWHVEKISDSELERMLEREANKTDGEPLIISLHFADWKHGKHSYYKVVEAFLISGAKDGKFKFYSMKEYLQNR
jgi:peptidoglycan/xylan/chitin deacetylase (PgdA/CDA1 family)